jgi:hypothetical protein
VTIGTGPVVVVLGMESARALLSRQSRAQNFTKTVLVVSRTMEECCDANVDACLLIIMCFEPLLFKLREFRWHGNKVF